MRNVWVWLGLPLALCLVVACASTDEPMSSSPDAPGGLSDPYAGSPRDQVMVGVGSARGIGPQAEDQARRSAMRRINEDILTRVKSELTTISSEFASGSGETDWEQEMYERIDLESEGDLPGAEVRDRWLDSRENTTYVLVSVDRELLLELLLEPVEASQTQAEAILEGQDAVDPDPARELTTQLRAYDAVAETFTDALRATSVASTATRGPSILSNRAQRAYNPSKQFLADLSDDVARKSSRIQIRKHGGDGQKGDPRERLEDDLEASVWYTTDAGEEVEMTFLPMRFRPAGAEGDVGPTLTPNSATTDARGLISCGVSDVVAGRSGRGSIVVEVDVERLGPVGETTVAVGVDTIHEGRSLEGVDVSRSLSGHLTAVGFKAVGRPDVLGPSESELARLLGADFDYVLRGTVLAEYRHEENGYHYYQATAEIQVVHLRSGRVVHTIAPERALKLWKTRAPAGAAAAVMTLEPTLFEHVDRVFVDGFGRQ
jgi:hypothetical protein